MNLTECFPMKKRRYSNDRAKTPKRSPRTSGKSWRTPRHLNSTIDQGLDIIWDNNSPTPGTYSLRKRKKHKEGESSSSGGEISDLVQKLADKSGSTPETNPPLLNFWIKKDAADEFAIAAQSKAKENENKKMDFQTPSRRPRRKLRKNSKVKAKLMSQELNALVKKIQDEAVHQDDSNVCDRLKLLSDSSESKIIEEHHTEPAISEELYDIWDDDDVILSQLDINQLYNEERQDKSPIFICNKTLESNTKSVCSDIVLKKTPKKSADLVLEETSPDEQFVSQLWELNDGSDYGDGDDGLLQSALEDFENSQSVSTASKSTSCNSLTAELVNHLSPSPPLVQRNAFKPENTLRATAITSCIRPSNAKNSHLSNNKPKILPAKEPVKTKNEQQVSYQQHTQTITNQLNVCQRKKYSKEAIEQKRREAQQKRKQKLTQHKQLKNSTYYSKPNKQKLMVP